MRKAIPLALMFFFVSIGCKKIERVLDSKHCWECTIYVYGGVGNTETIRTQAAETTCDMTTKEMFEFEQKGSESKRNNDGSWGRVITKCSRK